MTDSDKEAARYIFAGLAMNGLIQAFVKTGEGVASVEMIVDQSILIADSLMEAMEPKPEIGLAAIKPRRKRKPL